MTNLVIVRGLPGSGKTTTAIKYGEGLQCNWSHYEADQYFVDAEGNYNWDRKKIREAHEWCQGMVKEDMAKGYTVIVSNTFTTIRELEPYFDIASDYGITPTVILCQNDWGSVHDVPPDTMEAMRKRFQYDISVLLGIYNRALEWTEP